MKRLSRIPAGLVLAFALCTGTLRATVVDVSLTDTEIAPDTVWIAPGDTVRWTVASGVHQLHSDTDSYKSWDSGLLDTPGQTFELPFTFADGAGPFQYHDLGQGFVGAVLVSDTCFATGSLSESFPTVADLIYVMRVLAGGDSLPDNLYRLDVNGDCVVDSADARLIADFFQQGPDIFPQYPVPTCCFPTFEAVCPIALTGDVNQSGELTAADIIYMVSHIFKGFTGFLPCDAVGDVNCSGTVTSADVIILVNYLFKSGPPPCDVCTIIPVVWICPYPVP